MERNKYLRPPPHHPLPGFGAFAFGCGVQLPFGGGGTAVGWAAVHTEHDCAAFCGEQRVARHYAHGQGRAGGGAG